MDRDERLRDLPQVDAVLRQPDVVLITERHGRRAVKEAVRALLDEQRQRILAGAADGDESRGNGQGAFPSVAAIEREAARRALPSLRRVVNATGVVLHTNLGRAPLGERAVQRVAEVAGGYSLLELDVTTGRRGRRDLHAVAALQELTGAEDALVVNNNAAAVLLVMRALASAREVIVSRGELVEIGGSFRMPDVMAAGGATLREVGTTNRTHLADYRAAIGEQTALLLKVHRSNFAVVGFTAEVSRKELVELGRERGIPVVEDLGSGSLIDLQGPLAGREPTVRAVISDGVDLATFSGDKLLGGPQAGIIVGRAELVAKLRADPLLRAVRPDKMTFAALEATLEAYREGGREVSLAVPLRRALALNADECRVLADALLARIADFRPILRPQVVPVISAVGGGAYPAAELPGFAVALRPPGGPEAAERIMRAHEPPVIVRIADDQLLVDVRTLLPGDEDVILAACEAIG